ncbi:hypothetical protein PPERSA_00126 [Pseudocohnilembus persalinus]|uniref:RanBP2-type domain-containing protein n=1 Tax=Pseudocohnilembus persalinus TaxID=266149 RepID=A0A0V0Q8M4_PSEPJ|nr:hypothetical protein PPERSA_00126 [Pseudocohnilembus persalinus]|eukprot:KRW98529.1 hypothetical protein PPERSA_00126 [Pseudocohnilembus persalinus]
MDQAYNKPQYQKKNSFDSQSDEGQQQNSQEYQKKQDNRGKNVDFKNGDWHCPKCKMHNFARNTRCFQCKEQKKAQENKTFKQGDWYCNQCKYHNFASRNYCYQCDAKKVQVKKRFEDDWTCEKCNCKNFAKRQQCFDCNGPRSSNEQKTGEDKNQDTKKVAKQVEMKNGDWICLKCDTHNFARRTQCFQCHENRPLDA